MYVIKRTNQGGGYVARPGHDHSYTFNLDHVRFYGSREAAEKDRCAGNEMVEQIITY